MKNRSQRDDYGNMSEKMDKKVDAEETPAKLIGDSEYTQPACSLPMQVSQATILSQNRARGWDVAPENDNEDV